jgi:hypothetical protein
VVIHHVFNEDHGAIDGGVYEWKPSDRGARLAAHAHDRQCSAKSERRFLCSDVLAGDVLPNSVCPCILAPLLRARPARGRHGDGDVVFEACMSWQMPLFFYQNAARSCDGLTSMVTLSDEQEGVAAAIGTGKNVVSISKPGTGKSTVAFEIARRVVGRVLVLTFNSKLKEEGRERAKALGLADRVEVHSFHAAALRFFDVTVDATVDDGVLLESLTVEPFDFIPFDLVVLDEAQDLTPVLFDFCRRLLQINGPTQMLVVGDPFQRIFAYLGASWRYMSDPQTHFGDLLKEPQFEEHHLTVCWRITPEMSDWINTHLNPQNLKNVVPAAWWDEHAQLIERWWAGGLRSGRPSRPGSVLTFAEGEDDAALVAAVRAGLTSRAPGSCAILASTVRYPTATVRTLMEELPELHWVVAGEQSAWEYSEAAQLHKVQVSTYHRFKGLERLMVVVTGLDATIERGRDPLEAFALAFVAATRAQELLIGVHGGTSFATMRNEPLSCTSASRMTTTAIPQLLRHVPFDLWLSMPMARGGFVGLTEGVDVCHNPISNDRVEACRFVRTVAGVEDAAPYIDAAVRWLVMHRINPEVARAARMELRRGTSLQIRRTVDAVQLPLTPAIALSLAVAQQYQISPFPHAWRQHKTCSSELSSLIDDLAFNAELIIRTLGLQDEGAECVPLERGEDVGMACIKNVPHNCKALVRGTEGVPWVVSTGTRRTIVHLFAAPVIRHDDVLLATLWSAFDGVRRNEEGCTPTVLALVNKGCAYEVGVNETDGEPIRAKELLLRAMLRKHATVHPTSAQVDEAIEDYDARPIFFQ